MYPTVACGETSTVGRSVGEGFVGEVGWEVGWDGVDGCAGAGAGL